MKQRWFQSLFPIGSRDTPPNGGTSRTLRFHKWLVAFPAAAMLLVACWFLFRAPPRPGGGAVSITDIGILFNGNTEDRGYVQAQYEALVSVAAERGAKLHVRSSVPVDGNFPVLAEELIRQGCQAIFSDNYMFDDDLLRLAAAHPDVYFLNASGMVSADNLCSCLGRVYQVRYLSGIVAGMQTKTGQIGYIVGCLTPESIRQLDAFTIGVRKANPGAVVYVRHTDDWNDGEKAAAMTSELLDAHQIDVLTAHVNPVSPLRVANQRGVYTIGNNYDNRELFPETYLTACLFDWKAFFSARLNECVQGRFTGQLYWDDIESGLVSLAPLTDLVVPGAGAAVAAEQERMEKGQYDVFFGPVTDTYGTLQLREGENLSDETLLHSIFWLVDGVVME